MEIEYSTEIRGRVFAYRFTKSEQCFIADALKPMVNKLEKKIEKIQNHPKNEGQVTFICQIDELRGEIKSLEFIIKTFSE